MECRQEEFGQRNANHSNYDCYHCRQYKRKSRYLAECRFDRRLALVLIERREQRTGDQVRGSNGDLAQESRSQSRAVTVLERVPVTEAFPGKLRCRKRYRLSVIPFVS